MTKQEVLKTVKPGTILTVKNNSADINASDPLFMFSGEFPSRSVSRNHDMEVCYRSFGGAKSEYFIANEEQIEEYLRILKNYCKRMAEESRLAVRNKIRGLVICKLHSIGVTRPENLEDIVDFCHEFILTREDSTDWDGTDVGEGIRKWIESV